MVMSLVSCIGEFRRDIRDEKSLRIILQLRFPKIFLLHVPRHNVINELLL